MKRLFLITISALSGASAQFGDDVDPQVEEKQDELERTQDDIFKQLSEFKGKMDVLSQQRDRLKMRESEESQKLQRFTEQIARRCSRRKDTKHLHKNLATGVEDRNVATEESLSKLNDLHSELKGITCEQLKAQGSFLQTPTVASLQAKIDKAVKQAKENELKQMDQLARVKAEIKFAQRRIDHIGDDRKRLHESDAKCEAKWRPKIQEWKASAKEALAKKADLNTQLSDIAKNALQTINELTATALKC